MTFAIYRESDNDGHGDQAGVFAQSEAHPDQWAATRDSMISMLRRRYQDPADPLVINDLT